MKSEVYIQNFKLISLVLKPGEPKQKLIVRLGERM
jgi:hypothetical protein